MTEPELTKKPKRLRRVCSYSLAVVVVTVIGVYAYHQRSRLSQIQNIEQIAQTKMQAAEDAVRDGDLTRAELLLDEALDTIRQEESLDTLESSVRFQINLVSELVRASLNPTVKNVMSREQLALGNPIINSIGMVLVPIPSGEFWIGSSVVGLREVRDDDDDLIQHPVRISKPFYLGVYEVTQQQFESVMGGRPWKDDEHAQSGPKYAAANVSWEEAALFCKKLGQQEGVTYFLPTEAQWEYACRAGTNTAWSFGGFDVALLQHAWTHTNAWEVGEKYAHRVGQKLPNPWGLYDMHGNVWEWCHDWYTPKATSPDVDTRGYIKLMSPPKKENDPKGPAQGDYRVLRGGSFYDGDCRSASRLSYPPADRDGSFGFRVARTYR